MKFYVESNFQSYKGESVPADWTTVKIMDVASVKEGIYGKRSDNGKILQLKADSIRDNGQMNNNAFAKITLDRSIDDYLVRAGDVLLNNRNSAKLVGKSAIFRDGFPERVFGNLLTRIRLSSKEIIPEWLVFRLMQLHSNGFLMAISTRAVNQALLKKGTVEKIWIPVPPVTEQHQIVQVLAVVDSALELADQTIAKTERLKKGLMQQLLTHGIGYTDYQNTTIGKIPKDWEVTTIDKECSVGTGGTPSRNTAEYYGGKIFWVKSTEVDYGIIAKTEETITEEGVQNSNANVYPSGSLVMALYGQGTTRGKCAILGIEAAVNQACAVLQSKGQVHIPYLFYWCQNSYSAIRGLSQGANQANLNMGIIRSLNIPLPPISEQKRITEILSTIDNKLKIEKSEKAKTERIKQGLMDLLLTGKVRIKVD